MKSIRKTLLVTAATIAMCVIMVPGMASAASKIGAGSLGLGLGGGTLTSGITAKYYLGSKSAVQAVVGASGWGFGAGVDYVQEFVDIAQPSWGKFNLYGGAGGAFHAYDVGVDQAALIGVAGVLGINLHFTEVPLELATEWRPSFIIGDYVSGLHLGGAGGSIRWYF